MKFLANKDHLPIGQDLDMTTVWRQQTDKTNREDERNSRNYANALRSGISKQKGLEE